MPSIDIDITAEDQKKLIDIYLRSILSEESYSVYLDEGVEAGILNEAIINALSIKMK